MEIHKIEFRNVGSYGGQLQTLEFQKNNGDLHLIVANNGFGKSTISKAIIFALYGQVDSLNLVDLPNRINKNLWVKIQLVCKGQTVIIERGLAPKMFKVIINGKPLDQAGISNVQGYLEDEIFEMPYKVFKNVIILSINDFKSFITMKPKDKRLIIDRLFGFSIINDMYRIIKDERKELNRDIDNIKSQLITIEESIKTSLIKLNELEKISEAENKKQIKELKEILISRNEDFKKLLEAKSKLNELYEHTESQINEYNKELNSSQYNYNDATAKLKLYSHSNCPECEKPLDSDFDNKRKDKYNTIIETESKSLVKLKGLLEKLKNESNTISNNQRAINEKTAILKTKIEHVKTNLLEISDYSKNGKNEFKQLNSLIEDFKDKESNNESKQSELLKQDSFLSVLEVMLGDEGVKNLAVKSILPGLNANVIQMTNEMHLPFTMRFDEKFDCIITHLGEEINPMTMSTGERKKADFIIVIALIKLLKLRFPDLNLLFLDEIFSSVDEDGVYNILKILKEIVKEYNFNCMVINHTVLPAELFDKKVTVYKENGFSKFKIENLN